MRLMGGERDTIFEFYWSKMKVRRETIPPFEMTGRGNLSRTNIALCALNSNPKVGAEKPVSRPRAESLDVARYQKQQQEKNKEEKSMNYLYLAAVDNFSEDIKEEETPQKTNSTVRRRSLSCTVPSRKQTPPGGGNTMLQNTTIAEDLQYILGNSS